MKHYIFISFLLLSTIIVGQNNQDSIKKEFLTIGIGPQVNTFFGDVSPNNGEKIFTNNRPALTFDIEKRFGKLIGLQLMMIKGKLADHYYPENFMSKFLKTNLNIIFNTDNYFDNQHNFSIYSAIGIGAIKYNTFSDTLNTNPNSDPNSFDYIYETEISDEITFLAPISIGFKWKMNPYVQGRVYGTYNTLLSDDIDNIISGSNDSYASLGFTINYAFHKITRVKKERISIDLEKFDLTDEDGDGVIDLEDLCHHTPKKVEVDSKGCPKDKDKDGVPDYLDIEPDSKYILHVDELGRSLTDSIIYYRSQTDDSVEIEINKTFSIDTITNLNDSINVDIEKSTIPMDTILINKDSNKLENFIPNSDTILNNEMNYNPSDKMYINGISSNLYLLSKCDYSSVNTFARKEE